MVFRIFLLSLIIFNLSFGFPKTQVFRLSAEEPWGKDADLCHPSAPKTSHFSSYLTYVSEKIIRFHQQILSPVDGPRSHFRPSSSNYMLQAIQRNGFVKGFLLGCDRLLRENEEKWVYRTILEEGGLYKWDPPP